MNTFIFRAINDLAGQSQWLDGIMAFSANNLGYILVGLVFLVCYFNRNKYKEITVLSLGSAIVSRFIVVALIRHFYYNPRPFLILQNVHQLLEHDTESSFPSGHMAFYFALATVLYRYDRKIGITAFVLSGLMGFARIFVGVHWPLDIVAGIVVGVATALLSCKAYPRVGKILGI